MTGLVVVTGAQGFVGQAVLRALAARGIPARGVSRRVSADRPGHVAIADIGPETDWNAALAGATAVVHCAARVHMMGDSGEESGRAYFRVNTNGTLNLARQAAAAGVKRFVFVSSIKVNGEATCQGSPYTADDVPAPLDDYGRSKAEAERELLDFCPGSGMDCAIVRPPLVYGPGVKANFAQMMRIVRRGVPLPLGSVTGNRRSLVALDNLVDLLLTCLDHPRAANQIFLASDPESLSTADLLRRLGDAIGTPARLLPFPPALIRLAATLIGAGAVSKRLLDSLEVDIEKTKNVIGWRPPLTVDEGLRRAVGNAQ